MTLHENHAYGPQKFGPPVQNEFCNTIGTKLPIRDVRDPVATGDKPDMARTARIG